MASRNILAPIQKDDGCSYFRIETPSKYLRTNFTIDTPMYRTNKFSPASFRTGVSLIDRVSGSVSDRLKLKERVAMVQRQRSDEAFWLSRSLMSFDNRADRSVKNIIYDIDDSIWLSGEADHCFEHHCRESLVVFAGNAFIADHASKYSKNIEIVPTSVDLNYHVNTDVVKNTFNVGWIGSAAGLGYLNDIADQLIVFFEKHSDARLVIVTERAPNELTRLQKYIDYMPWSRATEIESLNKFTIGIMPLRDTDWDRGKCSFKMLQYMGCGIPAVVSPVGMNIEVMNNEASFGVFGKAAANDWADSLEYYYQLGNASLKDQGNNGRQVIDARYSTAVVTSSIASHFSKYL